MSLTLFEPHELIASRERYVALLRQQADGAATGACRSPRVETHPMRRLFDDALRVPSNPFVSQLPNPMKLWNGVGPFRVASATTILRDAASSIALLRHNRSNEHETWLANLVAFAPLPFFDVSASDNPEPIWYAELLMLHLLASYTWQFGDARGFDALAGRARHYQATTQADHATNEPWAVHAFAVDLETYYTADQILHAATMNAVGTGPHAVALMALRDALYSLEQYRPDSPKDPHD